MRRPKGLVLAVGLAGLLGLTAAACGSSSSSTTTTTAATSTTAGGTNTTTSGGSTGSLPVTDKDITCENLTLGFFGALTGDNANLGINIKNGAELAVELFSEANPGCKITLTPFDSQGSPDQAPGLATQAATDASLVGLVGPAFSGESRAANPILNEAGLPLITPSATNPALSTNGWTVFHRAVANDDKQGPAIAQYILQNLNAKKVAVIDDASEYGKGLADIVRSAVAAGGGQVVESDSIDPNAQDFSSTVTKVNAAAPEAVFFGGYYEAAGRLAKQLKDAGVTAVFVGPDGTRDEGFVTSAGPAAAEGAILTAPAAPVESVTGGPEFAALYEARFGAPPGLYSLEGFDSAAFILDAIANGNTTREAINNYLKNNSFQGLTKTLKFDANGELVFEGTGTGIYAYTVKDGKIVGVGPIGG